MVLKVLLTQCSVASAAPDISCEILNEILEKEMLTYHIDEWDAMTGHWFPFSTVLCQNEGHDAHARMYLVYESHTDFFIHPYHSSIVGSKPLWQSCGRNSNVACAFRAIWA